MAGMNRIPGEMDRCCRPQTRSTLVCKYLSLRDDTIRCEGLAMRRGAVRMIPVPGYRMEAVR